jgi:hypothetical protein
VDPNPRSTIVRAIVLTWLLAGTLDITAAVLQYFLMTGKNPVVVFLYIASGVFGADAFAGGIPMAVVGGLFHYCIALVWALLFFLAYPRINILSRNKYVVGLLYGLFIWLIMNKVVLPLSNVRLIPFDIGRAALAILILMLCVGLPISLSANRYYSKG